MTLVSVKRQSKSGSGSEDLPDGRDRTVTEPDSHARDPHPRLDGRTPRIRYIAHLMATMRWVRGQTSHELSEDWGFPVATVETWSSEAGRFLALLGEREEVLGMVREASSAWLAEGGQDRVQAARLLVDTVGGFTQKSEVTIREVAGLSQRQRQELVILELVKDEWAAGFFAEARAAHLAGRAVLTEGIDTTGVVLPLTDGSGERITGGEEEENDDA